MEPVLDIITSYESRIATVEELMTTAYQATETSDVSFDILDEERERLKTGLQKTLSKNCSLRRKDCNRLLERLLSNSTKNREAIEEERSRVREKVKEYLDEQKQLASYLRQQFIELTQEKMDKGCLDAVIGKIKASYEDTGQRLFVILRNFQLRLETYQREQEQINHKLQRLVDRGESLSLEDLRQLEAAEALQKRVTDRERRCEEMDRLLARFRQQRQESRRY
jgi:predicted  nucleic acid-binding Zn-ribbon protein